MKLDGVADVRYVGVEVGLGRAAGLESMRSESWAEVRLERAAGEEMRVAGEEKLRSAKEGVVRFVRGIAERAVGE